MAYDDEGVFRTWCASALPVSQPGLVNPHGLPGLLRAEIKWALKAHAQLLTM